MASRKNRDVLPSSIIPTLESYPQLSTLYSYVNGSTKLYNLLVSATNFTFLAPTNDAFTSWISSNGNVTSADAIEAALSYHLLNGSWPTVDFSDSPQFAPTNLNNASYSNVTIAPAGQRVEVITGSNGDPEFLSSNKTVTTIAAKDIVCLNGLIQVVNSILSIPTSLVLLTAQANMSFFTAILNRANFLSVDDAGLIDFVNYASFTPNMTFFVPNSAEALSLFTNTSTGLSAANLTALFDYHIVPGHVLYSPELVNGTILKTTQGDNITITRQGSDIYVNSAKILVPDYLIVNGVIHTIDNMLDRFNQTIPVQTTNTTSPSTTATPSTSATAASSHSGLSTGAIAAISVVIPVVVLAALAGLLFWFFKKRRASKQQHGLAADQARRELDGGVPAKELDTNDPAAKELRANEAAAKELHAHEPPQELGTGLNSLPPAELE